MSDIGYGEEALGDGPSARELRRTYHDRIAEVRERSLEMLRHTVAGVASAARVLDHDQARQAPPGACTTEEARDLAAAVDAEVVSLLALESPMARDLRVILASRDVTQIGLLCAGLCAPLPPRVKRAASAVSPDLRDMMRRIVLDTESLVQETEAAWAGLDETLVSSVEWAAMQVRDLQTDFLTSLLQLVGVPMEAAIDLAMVSRALERLVDHSLEIAERVQFALYGTTASPPES